MKNQFKNLLATLSIASITLAIQVEYVHADYTIATVSVNRVLNESKEAKVKKKEIDDLTAKAKKKVEDKKKSLQTLEKKIKDGEVAEDSAEAQTFRNEARDFARFVKDTESDIRSEFLKSNKTLTEKAVNLIAQYAKANNIDLVLDKSDNARGPVLYGSNTADITDAVVQQMNQ